MKSPLSIVILSRDLDGLLRVCLQHVAGSAAQAGWPDPDLLVIDNASRWPCPAGFEDAPAFRLARFDRHHSFAASCNHGAATCAGEFLLFLNNDVLLDRSTLSALRKLMVDHPRTAICGTRMIFPNRTVQHAGVVFGPDEIGPYHVHRQQLSTLAPRTRELFQAVTGAALLVRREVFARLGGFDEAYPFGLEDIDLCLRAGQAGHEIRCSQATESLHFESMTPGREDLDKPSRALFMQRWRGRYAIDG